MKRLLTRDSDLEDMGYALNTILEEMECPVGTEFKVSFTSPKSFKEADEKSIGPWTPGSATSEEAARSNCNVSALQRRKIMEYLACDPCCRDKLSRELNLVDSAVDARIENLRDEFWFVEETEEKERTQYGKLAYILRLTERGADYLESRLDQEGR